MDTHCESQAASIHSCLSHPSYSQEMSLGPSLLSIGSLLVHWAVTRGLLGNSGAASLYGHCVCHCRLWWLSGGCCYMTLWKGYPLWLSAWVVLVLGQAWVQWRPLCEAVRDHRSVPPSSFDFDSFETC